jgi:hypothetical protein
MVALKRVTAKTGERKDFSNWIKDRIKKYGFEESQDFVIQNVFRSPNLASENRKDFRGGLNRVEYHITLEMAKDGRGQRSHPAGFRRTVLHQRSAQGGRG